MAIQAKKKPNIQKGETIMYNPATFKKEHKVESFFEVEDPQFILDNVKPYEFAPGRRIIIFDTEANPYFKSSHEVPKDVVRRWIGTGKKATPIDLPFCISICDGTSAYSIFDTPENGFEKFKALAPLFEDPTIEKVAHNTKFDMHMFANANLKIVGRLHDTVVLTKLTDENRKSFQLRELAAKHPKGIVKFEYMVDSYKQLNKITDYRDIPHELLSEYANADVWNCFWVFISEYERLEPQDLTTLYNTECELMVALYAMERYGMDADPGYEGPLKEDLTKLVDEAEQSIYDEAGKIFNINSGKQLYEVLMALGINKDWITMSDKGNPVLDKDALNILAEKHNVSIVVKILEYRKYVKLLGTYAEGIYAQRDKANKVHGSINQTEATTGRMSITKPALQTLPKKDKRIRRAFVPDKNSVLYFMDLDQVEYRLFAHYAQATGLIQAIKDGKDIHTATAALIFNVPYDEVTEEQRSKAKTINFGLIYGQGNELTAMSLKMSLNEAVRFKENYFAQIPEAKPFINTVHQVIRARGFVKNAYGRRRRLKSDDAYKAPNALIQGCAADYIKSKVVNIYKFIQYHELLTKMINIVHDEVVIDSVAEEKGWLCNIRWLLSDFKSFRVPITAGIEKGAPSWGQKEEVNDIDFMEPADKEYLNYNVYDGSVFDIYKEAI